MQDGNRICNHTVKRKKGQKDEMTGDIIYSIRYMERDLAVGTELLLFFITILLHNSQPD